MESFKLIDRKARYIAAAGALLLSTLLPVLAAAAQVTERSIQLSSSSVNATGVTYNVSFKTTGAAGAFVLDFCENTPLYGEDCDFPTGFNVGTPTSATSGFTNVEELGSTNNKLRVVGAMSADTAYSVAVAGITNPSAAGPLYARIVTFDTEANAEAYVSNPVEPAVNTGMVDEGGVAISITPTIGVSGAVLETLTFCVSGPNGGGTNPITANCGGTLTSPTLRLGADTGGVIALDSASVYSGTIYTQLSTNAVDGAVVRLKSSATGCGGLLRSSDTSACNILPAGSSGTIAAGDAKFGIKTGAADTDASGTIQPFTGGIYDATNYRLGYAANNSTGVTSPYGDALLDTDDAPANNKAMPLTFGASVSNNTPAGNYSADLSLIATGKF